MVFGGECMNLRGFGFYGYMDDSDDFRDFCFDAFCVCIAGLSVYSESQIDD
jgi:hypothetical protein